MTLKELNVAESFYRKECDDKIRAIQHQYAIENNPINIGDIITDHIGSIKVETIRVCHNTKYPTCIYNGFVVTKNGSISKRQTKRDVYQINIISERKVTIEITEL